MSAMPLTEQIDAYFKSRSLSKKGTRGLRIKAAFFLLTLASAYLLLIFWAPTPLAVIGCSLLVTFAIGGIGFCVAHDGNHGAFSTSAVINRLAGMTYDLIGVSSYLWKWKHNVFHHSNPNVIDWDDDINALPALRLSNLQPHFWFHRYQHIYAWPLYCLIAMRWQLWGDLVAFWHWRIGSRPIRAAQGGDLAIMILGKGSFLFFGLIFPMFFHPPAIVLATFAFVMGTLGLMIGTVFQLAHCTEGARFEDVPAEGLSASDRLRRQIEATVNFCPNHRFLSWYVGGLNFQIEHHLAPQVAHVHYPGLAVIVRDFCASQDITYRSHETLSQALAAHWRHLREVGQGSIRP